MNSSLLRFDWYSFVVGTQISSVIGVLTTATSFGVRIRFPREYLYPSLHNNGTSLFLYRIKESGNLLPSTLKLLCRAVEKNIVAGVVYIFTEKSVKRLFALKESIVAAFACGGIVGLYSFFSYNHFELRGTDIFKFLICCLASAEVSALYDEIKTLLYVDLDNVSFDFKIPFEPIIFWSGAIVGCLVGIMHSNFLYILDEIPLPLIDDTDTKWDVFLKYLGLFDEISLCTIQLTLNMNERLLASGIIQCTLAYLTKKVTSWEDSLLIGIVSTSLHGIYLGLETGRFKPAMKLSWVVAGSVRTLCWLYFRVKKLALPAVE